MVEDTQVYKINSQLHMMANFSHRSHVLLKIRRGLVTAYKPVDNFRYSLSKLLFIVDIVEYRRVVSEFRNMSFAAGNHTENKT